MVNDPNADTQPSLSKLMGGIVGDTHELMQQQFALFRSELKEDLRTARDAALQVASAAALLFIGVIMAEITVAFAIAHFVPSVALWQAFAIVTVATFLGGGIVLYAANRKFQAMKPIAHQSTQAFTETARWLANPK